MKSITLKDKVSKSSWRKIFCTTRSIGLSSLFCSVAIADETVSNLAKVLELQTKDPSSIELVSSNYSSKFVPSVSPGFYQLKDDMTKGDKGESALMGIDVFFGIATNERLKSVRAFGAC
ncbi:hypothetical protein [Helicobacter cholecystus]|uniref:hypothetical protein n=1 Tax=Helicobacter cholecystus TaxID=45498 RepID=UPI00273867A5|nr:hypothetical protein [Helicobacter cholecystus]